MQDICVLVVDMCRTPESHDGRATEKPPDEERLHCEPSAPHEKYDLQQRSLNSPSKRSDWGFVEIQMR